MIKLSQNSDSAKITSTQSGFTLIELMVAVAIVAILATIAIPSYRRYMVQKAQNQTQAKMKQLQIELESWRANSLTYKGFTPKKITSTGATVFSYDNAGNTEIAVPDTESRKYTITLLADRNGAGSTLVPTDTNFSTSYNAWRMVAVPSETMKNYGAQNLILTSSGKACMGIDITVTQTLETEICSDVGAKRW